MSVHSRMKQQGERGKVIVNWDSVWMVTGSQGIVVWRVAFVQGAGLVLIGGGALKM